MNFFFIINISKYMRYQWLKIDLQAVLDLPKIMDGLDCDCGTHKVGFQSKRGYHKITLETLSLRRKRFLGEWSTVRKCFAIFSLSTMNHDAKLYYIAIVSLMKRLNCSDFTKGYQEVPNLMINDLDFFVTISKNFRNQRLKFYYMAFLVILNLINGLDCACESHKIGFQNKKGNL